MYGKLVAKHSVNGSQLITLGSLPESCTGFFLQISEYDLAKIFKGGCGESAV